MRLQTRARIIRDLILETRQQTPPSPIHGYDPEICMEQAEAVWFPDTCATHRAYAALRAVVQANPGKAWTVIVARLADQVEHAPTKDARCFGCQHPEQLVVDEEDL
jgi:hypothetical protein